jgi:hypothetical protein
MPYAIPAFFVFPIPVSIVVKQGETWYNTRRFRWTMPTKNEGVLCLERASERWTCG